ncbi:MAG: TatD family hydrolase [Acidilobaceae archaeon]
MLVYDMHCHLYEYGYEEVSRILEKDRELRVVAVSDDLDSLMRTLELSQIYPDRVVPCAGFHPWNLRRGGGLLEVDEVLRIAYRVGISCLGEVGIDARFVPSYTMQIQREVFLRFLNLARETSSFLVLHTPDAWREVLELLEDFEIDRALFHWYTGPLDLAQLIALRGYKVSINPAIRIQEKHAQIAKSVPLSSIVFESDAPYEYRGLKLSPLMVRDTVKLVAEIRGLSVADLLEVARGNSEKLLGRSLA